MYARGRGRGIGQPKPQNTANISTAPTNSAWSQAPGHSSVWPRPPNLQSTTTVATNGRGSHQAAPNSGPCSSTNEGNVSKHYEIRKREIIVTTKPEGSIKQATSGVPVRLHSNYVEVSSGEWVLKQYHVDFSPDIDSTRVRKQLFKTAVNGVITVGYLFDGTVVYCSNRIQNCPLDLFVTDDNGSNVKVTIRFVNEVMWTDPGYIQIFNIIMRKCFTILNYKLVGRQYYDNSKDTRLVMKDFNIEIWPGFISSIRKHEYRHLMNLDLSFKLMRQDNCFDMWCELGGDMTAFRQNVVGAVVLTYYNNKTYRIDDVEFTKTPNDTFQLKDGSTISYLEYFQKKYNITVKVKNQPILVSRSKPREIRIGMPETVHLIPELCQMTGLTEKQRSNFKLMQELARYTRIGPRERVHRLQQFAEKLQQPECLNEIKRYDLNFATSLIEIKGRVLAKETILSGDNMSCVPQNGNFEWGTVTRNRPMWSAVKMERFAIICPNKLSNEGQTLLKNLKLVAGNMKYSLGATKIFYINDDRTRTYLEMLRQVATQHPTEVLVILPNNSKDRYDSIKKLASVELGICTQLMLLKNVMNRNALSIATNVTYQLNSKLGGCPWTVNIPLKNTVIIGYDACRDTVNKKKCFGAMVATLECGRPPFFHRVYEHQNDAELSPYWKDFVVRLSVECKNINKELPRLFIVFRDAVGDGQYKAVYDLEVKTIKATLNEIYGENNYGLLFIITTKRINTKFFVNKTENPQPGTVVDDVVTLPERLDFFLVSQCVRMGTVSPTYYNVIDDTRSGLNSDRMQILTNKLTYMYPNFCGPIKVPNVVQCAHKLSFLTSNSLHQNAHENLRNLPFFY